MAFDKDLRSSDSFSRALRAAWASDPSWSSRPASARACWSVGWSTSPSYWSWVRTWTTLSALTDGAVAQGDRPRDQEDLVQRLDVDGDDAVDVLARLGLPHLRRQRAR